MISIDNIEPSGNIDPGGEQSPRHEFANRPALDSQVSHAKKISKNIEEHVPRSVLYTKDLMRYYGCCNKTAVIKMAEVKQKLNLSPKAHINIIQFARLESCTEEEMRRMLRIT